MDFGILTQLALSLLLHILRVAAFFAVVPIFGRNKDSLIFRLILAISFGAILWWVGDKSLNIPVNVLELAVMALREAVIGFALGYCFAAILSMLVMAGEVISMEMGFSMARSINPESGGSTTVVSSLLQVMGTLLVFALDMHHDALRIVALTFETCPVGQPYDYQPIWDGIVTLVSGVVRLAIQFSMPIIGVMLLMSTGTVLIGRAIPSINMMEFAFGLRVLMALGILGFYIAESMPYIIVSFEGLFDHVATTFGG